jgi:hypothetical protein
MKKSIHAASLLFALTVLTSISTVHSREISTCVDRSGHLLLLAQDVTKKDPDVAPLKGAVQATSTDAGAQSNTLQSGANSLMLETGAKSGTLQTGTNSTTLQTGTNSTTLQTGTNSTTLQSGTNSTMLQTGTNSTMLQTGTNSTMLHTGTAGTMIHAGIERKAEPANILILLDCSNTMQQGLDGTTKGEFEGKLAGAKSSLRSTLRSIPSDVKVGLRVFGNNFRSDETDCKQSFLLVPIGQKNRGEIVAKADALRAFGLTPLDYALRQSVRDFEGLEGTRRIILISDGQDTCGGDPCKVMQTLARIGFKMKVDIIGTGIKEVAAREQLDCIAKSSGGKYYDAKTAAELTKRVTQSALEAIAESAADKSVAGQIVPKPAALRAAPANKLEQ